MCQAAAVGPDEPDEPDAPAGSPDDLVEILAHAILPGERRYTADELARVVGVERAISRRFWRALGFPDPAPDDRIFTDADAEALRAAVARLRTPADIDQAVGQARAVAAGLAMIAETWTDAVVGHLRALTEAGATDDAIVQAVLDDIDLPRIGPILDYAHRIQLLASLQRRIAWGGAPGEAQRLVVGFADLVGYTSLTQQLTGGELEALIVRFEAVTRDAIAAAGGRVVKSLGDAVLFAAPDAPSGVHVAGVLAAALAASGDLPPARIGLDVGSVVQRDGDIFGAPVNRAHRIVQVAPAGAVVVSPDLREELLTTGAGDVELESIGTRPLKDVGPTELWVAR
jgi:adenylate cyclase